jgi:hypothetical protein
VDASKQTARQDGPEVCCHCASFYGLHPANCPCPKPPEPIRDDPPPEAFGIAGKETGVFPVYLDAGEINRAWRFGSLGDFWRKARER